MRCPVSSALILVTALMALACADPSPPVLDPPASTEAPIPLGPSGSHPLVFQHVLYRIPAGQRLGEARVGGRHADELRWSSPRTRTREYNIVITDLLRAHGYRVRDQADDLFGQASASKVRFAMAGILHDVELDFDFRRVPNRRSGSDSSLSTC